MQDPNDDLARTRHAFQLWRANRQRRTRIPLALWQQAVSLLDRFPISRVARELQLDPSALKKRQALTGAHVNQTLTTPQFFTLSSLDLTQHCHCEPHPQMTSSASQLTEADLRLVIEHSAGHCLTLSLPPSQWPRLETLCLSILRQR